MKYDRVHATLQALDPKEWVNLGERFALRADVRLQLTLEEVVDGEEIGECCGQLPDKYETWVLRYSGVELADYVFAVMDRREATSTIVPYGYEDAETVSLIHTNVGALLYGRETIDASMKQFGVKVSVGKGLI